MLNKNKINKEESDIEPESDDSEIENPAEPIIQPIHQLQIVPATCLCKTKCKTKRCPCVSNNQSKCNTQCHPQSKICENLL
jgi:hypothetical protein